MILPASIFLLNVTETDVSTLMRKEFSAGRTDLTSGFTATEIDLVSSSELVVFEEDPVELSLELLQPLKTTAITGSRNIRILIFLNN